MSFIIPETAEKGSPRLHLPSDKAGLGRSRWLGPDGTTGLAGSSRTHALPFALEALREWFLDLNH